MVERPIKKSEREVQQQEKGERSTPAPIKAKDRQNKEPQDGETSGGSSRDRDDRDGRDSRGRGKGKGKGRGRRDEAKAPPLNPALVRGPRPSAKVAVEEEPVEPAVEEGEVTEAAATDTDTDTDTDTPTADTPTTDGDAAVESSSEDTAPASDETQADG